MPFGYTGNFPNQQVKNSGIFSPEDVLNLSSVGEYGGSLQHIETKTASSSSALDFTTLGNYDVHFMTLDNFQCTTSTTRYCQVRVSNDNGSSFESGSNYQRAWRRVDTSGSVASINGTSETSMSNFFSIDSDSRTSQAYIYFYNLFDSSKFSIASFHSWNSVGDFTYFGGMIYTVAEKINALRLFPDSDAFLTGTAKLYGVKEIE